MFFLFPELNSIKNVTMLKKLPDHFNISGLRQYMFKACTRYFVNTIRYITVLQRYMAEQQQSVLTIYKSQLPYNLYKLTKYNLVIMYVQMKCPNKPFTFFISWLAAGS